MPHAKEIALYLESPMRGADLVIAHPGPAGAPGPGSVCFLSTPSPHCIEALNKLGPEVLCIVPETIADSLSCTLIVHPDPRLAFCKALNRFFAKDREWGIHPTAQVSPGAAIHAMSHIGPNVVIGEGCSIGKGTVVMGNSVIGKGTRIGENCLVKSNTTIGQEGFGYARDEEGRPVAFIHFGGVRIGDNVVIGANCTVVQAALETTVIEDDVKLDDHVHIAHNCRIGAGTLVAAGATLSGGVEVGANTWISPNATIIDGISIGRGAKVGIGAVVLRNVDAGRTVFGNPAKALPRTSKK